MYNEYEITGNFLEDREKVARAIDDPFLSYEQKEAIINEHNFRNLDGLSTDTYLNRIAYGVVNENPVYYPTPIAETNTYSDNYVSDTSLSYQFSTPKVYDVSFSDGHLFFDDKKA